MLKEINHSFIAHNPKGNNAASVNQFTLFWVPWYLDTMGYAMCFYNILLHPYKWKSIWVY